MKRLSLCTLIVFGILAQISAGLQKPPDNSEKRGIYIALLRDPSVAEKVTEWVPSSHRVRREMLRGSRALRYRQEIAQRQERLVEELETRGPGLRPLGVGGEPLRVLHGDTLLLNYLVIEASRDEIDRLRQRPEIRGVYPNLERRPLMDAVPAFVGAPELWDALGGVEQAGAGIKIAIIDSGINIAHTMFQDVSLSPPPGFPLGSPGHTNNKVIVARSYISSQFGLTDQADNSPAPCPDSASICSHGSRVAGIAAGSPATAPWGLLQGIAPRAFLANYRVFGGPNTNTTTTTAAILAALTDALNDGMDVINLSLGGTARDPRLDPEQQMIKNLTELGIIVVVAAGNSGPQPGTVLSPGTSPEAITVGATSHPRILFSGSPLDITSDTETVPETIRSIDYVPGNGAPITEVVGPLPIVAIASLDETEQACDPLPAGSLSGQVALVRRGGSTAENVPCYFGIKAENILVTAGAVGMVVYNDEDGAPVTMDFTCPEEGALPPGSCIADPPSQPAVMISREPGEVLRDFLVGALPAGGSVQAASAFVTFRNEERTVAFPADEPDEKASFSGSGPVPYQISGIKPDLSAPGTNVWTASNTSGFARGDGTSFATPVVAGAAALLRQLYGPELPVPSIKSLLVNTADPTVTVQGQPASVNQGGNGRINLAAALDAAAALSPTSLNFGVLKGLDSQDFKQTVEITNLTQIARRVSLESTQPADGSPVTLFVSPSAFELQPWGTSGDSRQIEITVRLPVNVTTGTFEGRLRIRDELGGSDLTIPYWGGLAVEGGRILEVSQAQGSPFSSVNEALAAALPGDIIQINDSGTYGPAVIHTNQDGLFLDGLQLRAAAGETPVIDGLGDRLAIGIFGLEGITIEGLTVRSGDSGIFLDDAGAVIRNNVIESDLLEPGEFGPFGISLQEGSHAHIFENEIRMPSGHGTAVFDSSALIQKNRFGDTVMGNGQNGVFAGSASDAPGSGTFVSLFDNIIENSGAFLEGQGIRLSDASVLIKGNVVANTQGGLGDGILVRGSDARVWVQDNRIESNERTGVSALQGADVTLWRNTIQGNGLAGLWVQDARGEVHSTRLIENGTGVLSNSAELELTNSLISHSIAGHGLSANFSTLTLLNSTLFGNAQRGADLAGTTATIGNSIFFANSGEDLAGAEDSLVSFNLFENGPLVGSSGNFSGNPLFADPDAFDFSLQNGSDAIDRGSDTLPIATADLLMHQRVVDGNSPPDGMATVDVGAVEFGSGRTSAIILPVLSVAEREFVGLAMANVFAPPAGSDPAGEAAPHTTEVRLNAYSQAGELYATVDTSVDSGTQLPRLLGDLFPSLQEGWIEILPTHPDLMSFTLVGTFGLDFLDGAQLGPARARTLLFPEIRNGNGESTRLYLVNPNSETAVVTLRWTRPSENGLTRNISFGPKNSLSVDVQDLFGETCGQACSDGYITAETEVPIYGLEIFGSAEYKGGLSALTQEDASPELYAAQLASTDEVETLLNIINTGSDSNVLITAWSEAGQRVGEISVALEANQQWRIPAGQAFGFRTDQEGWVEIQSDSGALLGALTFGDPEGRFLAALPLQNKDSREFVLSHVAETPQIFTGVTLLNAGAHPALITLEVFAPEGERTGVAFLDLSARQKTALLLSEVVEGITSQNGGFIRIRSSTGILGFEIFGSTSLDYFSAVPQQVVVY